jgi:hypothetical protein
MNARDFSRLTIAIDSSSLKVATKGLERLGSAGAASESKIKKLAAGIDAIMGASNSGEGIYGVNALAAGYGALGSAIDAVGRNASRTYADLAKYGDTLKASSTSVRELYKSIGGMAMAITPNLQLTAKLPMAPQNLGLLESINFDGITSGTKFAQEYISAINGLIDTCKDFSAIGDLMAPKKIIDDSAQAIKNLKTDLGLSLTIISLIIGFIGTGIAINDHFQKRKDKAEQAKKEEERFKNEELESIKRGHNNILEIARLKRVIDDPNAQTMAKIQAQAIINKNSREYLKNNKDDSYLFNRISDDYYFNNYAIKSLFYSNIEKANNAVRKTGRDLSTSTGGFGIFYDSPPSRDYLIENAKTNKKPIVQERLVDFKNAIAVEGQMLGDVQEWEDFNRLLEGYNPQNCQADAQAAQRAIAAKSYTDNIKREMDILNMSKAQVAEYDAKKLHLNSTQQKLNATYIKWLEAREAEEKLKPQTDFLEGLAERNKTFKMDEYELIEHNAMKLGDSPEYLKDVQRLIEEYRQLNKEKEQQSKIDEAIKELRALDLDTEAGKDVHHRRVDQGQEKREVLTCLRVHRAIDVEIFVPYLHFHYWAHPIARPGT